MNRGWVPKAEKPQARALDSNEIEIEAIYRQPESKVSFMPDNDEQKNQWYYIDTSRMSEIADSEPILLEMVQGSLPSYPPIIC